MGKNCKEAIFTTRPSNLASCHFLKKNRTAKKNSAEAELLLAKQANTISIQRSI